MDQQANTGVKSEEEVKEKDHFLQGASAATGVNSKLYNETKKLGEIDKIKTRKFANDSVKFSDTASGDRKSNNQPCVETTVSSKQKPLLFVFTGGNSSKGCATLKSSSQVGPFSGKAMINNVATKGLGSLTKSAANILNKEPHKSSSIEQHAVGAGFNLLVADSTKQKLEKIDGGCTNSSTVMGSTTAITASSVKGNSSVRGELHLPVTRDNVQMYENHNPVQTTPHKNENSFLLHSDAVENTPETRFGLRASHEETPAVDKPSPEKMTESRKIIKPAMFNGKLFQSSISKKMVFGHEKRGTSPVNKNQGLFNNDSAFKSLDTEFQDDLTEKVPKSCDFCSESSEFICNVCYYFYCTSCLEKLHPKLGPYTSHTVERVETDPTVAQFQRCVDHGLVASLFCSYCLQKRCPECANTTCFLHFKGKVNETDIELAKSKLLEDFEKASAKLTSVNKYKEMVERELENTRTTALLQKELIRQEFISFHELLVEKEEKLLQALEKDTEARLKHIKDTLETAVTKLEQDDARLTTKTTDLLQTENASQFIEEYAIAEDLCNRVEELVHEFDRNWAKNCTYRPSYLLDQPLSMLQEKQQLADKLDHIAQGELCLKFKQTTLYLTLQTYLKPVPVAEYLDIPPVPPSTEVSYIVEVYIGNQKVYQLKTDTLKDVTLNTLRSCEFKTGERYLIKVASSYKDMLGKPTVYRGSTAHMLVVVWSSADGKQSLNAGTQIPSKQKHVGRAIRRRTIRK